MIINSDVVRLVAKIEQTSEYEPYLKELIQILDVNCKAYNKNKASETSLLRADTKYPISDGYAKGFDPLHESTQLLEHWEHYGFVVGANVVNQACCDNTISKILEIAAKIDLDFTNQDTWLKDKNNTSILSRGFFEIYHDDVLAQIRQSLRLYLFHVLLWKTPYLWSTFDRLGVKIPEGEEAIGLPLHVDQNPTVHSKFTTIQGVLALEDCPVERGTFMVALDSVRHFHEYETFVAAGYKGEYVPLVRDSDLFKKLSAQTQIIPLRAGNIVSWDSRTTHANSSNVSNQNRYVCYTSTGIAKEDDCALIDIRKAAFTSGLGENKREAYLHASKKPRYTDTDMINSLRSPEKLNVLGECLYGFKRYKDI